MKRKEYKAPVFIGQNIYVKPSYIVSIPEFHRENEGMSAAYLENQNNLKDNDQKGKLSRKAITNLKNSINWLCISAKKKWVYVRNKEKWFNFKINFVTLTLPDTKDPIRSDDLQKRLLNPFLTYMRKYHGLKNYVWRLEFQANGKLHVHLTSDTFLHLQIIRDTWNRLLEKNGYLNEFYAKNGHWDPNSTDVHATRKIKNIAAYIAKYMSKQGAEYTYPLKEISDQIKKATEDGYNEASLKTLEAKRNKILSKPVNRLRLMNPKAWYKQKVNFWNSPFNPRPITGRIWSCSIELAKANKCKVHIPSTECAHELKSLMNREIEFRELTFKPPQTEFTKAYPDHPTAQPRKIGELYFLKATDWIDKINGVIKQKFEETRSAISSLVQTHSFELY